MPRAQRRRQIYGHPGMISSWAVGFVGCSWAFILTDVLIIYRVYPAFTLFYHFKLLNKLGAQLGPNPTQPMGLLLRFMEPASEAVVV
jgi:hypothetical protein